MIKQWSVRKNYDDQRMVSYHKEYDDQRMVNSQSVMIKRRLIRQLSEGRMEHN